MISICIPHYNFANPHLFENLFSQCEAAEIRFEIIIIDDASEIPDKAYLSKFNKPQFQIYFLAQNIGRSAIRNLLASKAKYPYLLFLDADSEIISKNFIANYIKELGDGIISGGRLYHAEKPSLSYLLHYKYGKAVEQNAQSQFQSNNFIVPKSVFSSLLFDEEIKGYGYEDVVFGLNAKELGIKFKRINNPVKHIQLKTNEEFVNDLEQALINLEKLIAKKTSLRLAEEVKVSAFYLKLNKLKLTFLLSIGNKKVLKTTKQLLLSNFFLGVTLLIAIYKLYFYHSLKIAKDSIPYHSSL